MTRIGFKWAKRALRPKQVPSCFDDDSNGEPMDINDSEVIGETKSSQQTFVRKKVNVYTSISDEEYRAHVDRIANLCGAEDNSQALEAVETLLMKKCDEKVLEMKAQILMHLDRHYEAVKCCEILVRINPLWWEGHQTHGRALLAFGEPELALKAFQRAVRINPADEELRAELHWIIDHAKGETSPENADLRNLVQLRKTSCIILPLYNW